jgi:GMP synthase-like glutamine amidotransferase
MKLVDSPTAHDRLTGPRAPAQPFPKAMVRPSAAVPVRLLFVQNCPTEGIGIFENRLQELAAPWVSVHPYAGEALPPLDGCDAIIVGGTPVSANEIDGHDFLRAEARWLKEALDLGKPILGICFGAQLLARLLGAGVKKNPVMEIGAYAVRLTAAGRSDPLFQGFPKAFPVFHWHADTFDIPPWGLQLATGRECPNQGFRMGSALGLQFHLEVSAEEAGRWAGAYADELRAAGKSKGRVTGECRRHEAVMARLARLMLDNFLTSIMA